jgi:prophage maintenance system killer protein
VTFYPTIDKVIAIHAQLLPWHPAAALLNRRWRGRRQVTTTTSFRKRLHFGKACRENHPFVDGNKRVAVTVTAAFLKVNGYELKFDDVAAFSFLIGLYESGSMRFKELETWLRMHATRREAKN